MTRHAFGSPEHREWLIACVAEAARANGTPIERITQMAVVAYFLRQPRGHRVFWKDWATAGGFRSIRAEAAARQPSAPVEQKAPPAAPVVAPAPPPPPPPAPPPPAPPPDALELHRLRSALDDMKRRERELLERLDAAERMSTHVAALAADGTPIGVQRRERVFGKREATALALASDWHLEELVDPATVGGVNAYDLAIAERSARRFFEGIVWLIDFHGGAFSVRDLVLWLGGDIISNTIHEELLESNLLAPLVATRFAREVIVRGIRMLLEETELERIVVPCSYGNHGRTTAKPRISTGAVNSYEVALYHQLADDFRHEPRVRFVVSRGELLYLDVYDLVVRFTHGDAVKYGGGIGGITIPINKALAGWGSTRRADLTCMGHWHQYISARGLITNGSLVGYGPFSQRVKATFEPPQQAFCLIDSRRGVCQSTPIWIRDDDHEHVLDPARTDAIKERLLAGAPLE
jgi:hypothetical protein